MIEGDRSPAVLDACPGNASAGGNVSVVLGRLFLFFCFTFSIVLVAVIVCYGGRVMHHTLYTVIIV